MDEAKDKVAEIGAEGIVTTEEVEVISITIGDTLDLKSASKEVIEADSKSFSSSYNTGGYSYNHQYDYRESDYRSIYFYEFSDVYGKPKFFSTVSAFLKWAKECGVQVSTYMEGTLKRNSVSYCCCMINCSTIIRADNATTLRSMMENLKKNKEEREKGRVVSSVNSNMTSSIDNDYYNPHSAFDRSSHYDDNDYYNYD